MKKTKAFNTHLKFTLSKIVVVDWVDACSPLGWLDKETYLESHPLSVRSVGYLLKHTKDCLTIIGTQAIDDGMSLGLTIPAGWVKSVKVIKG